MALPSKQIMTLLGRAAVRGRKFLNPVPTSVGGLSMIFRVLPRFLTGRKQRYPSGQLGPFATDPLVYRVPPASGLRVTWFGHSSMLLEIDGLRVLIDPVWDQRASPWQWSGPKRFFQPTLALPDLPPIDIVLISHDHYDHLGERTIRQLARQANCADATWVTSLCVGSFLQSCGVDSARITELDWTETHRYSARGHNLSITSLPARHFSGRGLANRFETLWASFAINGDRHSVYYGADSGPWPGFAEIGRDRAFDLVMLEIGAFDPLWGDIHLGPDGAVAAWEAMGSKGMFMPIHWGLFNLALHPWTQPIERLRLLAAERSIPIWSPEPGLPTEVLSGVQVRSNWWMDARSRSV